MQVEPPGSDLPAHRHQGTLGPLRLSAALGAAVLALASTGNVFVLAGLLVVVAATRAGALAVLLACTAVLVRWGEPSLSAAGGAQAVLGPAVVVGSFAAAASAVCAALALALSARDRVVAGAFGLAAGAVALGPSFPHAIAVRVLGIVLGVAVAYAASVTRWRRSLTAAAVFLGALAVVLAVAA